MHKSITPFERMADVLKLVAASLRADAEMQFANQPWLRLFSDQRISDPSLNICSVSRVLVNGDQELLDTSMETSRLISELVGLRTETGNLWYGILFDITCDGQCFITYIYDSQCKSSLLADDRLRRRSGTVENR